MVVPSQYYTDLKRLRSIHVGPLAELVHYLASRRTPIAMSDKLVFCFDVESSWVAVRDDRGEFWCVRNNEIVSIGRQS